MLDFWYPPLGFEGLEGLGQLGCRGRLENIVEVSLPFIPI